MRASGPLSISSSFLPAKFSFLQQSGRALLLAGLLFSGLAWGQQDPGPSTAPGTAHEQQANSVDIGERQAAEHTRSTASQLPGLSASGIDAPPDIQGLDVEHRVVPLRAPLVATTVAAMPVVPPPLVPRTTRHIDAKYDVNKIGDRRIGKGLDFYSFEKEEELGREMASEVEAQARMVKDPIINEYINRVGQNLVRNSDAKVPFRIKVVDNDEVNAFALPGGFFYVNSGLILAADNEAELAGVMAHEIAHVAARHATKNATRNEIFNLASIPLVFVGGPIGYAVRQAVGLALPMSMLKFSRDAEREADMLGLEYQYASGYDPEEFVRFFEKLKAGESKRQNFLAKAFATHPMTEDRIKRAQETISAYLPARREYIIDTSEFQQIKARLQMLDNGRRIDGGKAGSPTLRRRVSSAEASQPDDRPRLQRK